MEPLNKSRTSSLSQCQSVGSLIPTQTNTSKVNFIFIYLIKDMRGRGGGVPCLRTSIPKCLSIKKDIDLIYCSMNRFYKKKKG